MKTATTWTQALEEDQDADDKARAAEWAAEHRDPIEAALARARAAEGEVAREIAEDIEEWEDFDLGPLSKGVFEARLVRYVDQVRADERAKVLAGFIREDTAPWHGFTVTEPGYWRLVGPKHYKPTPTPEQMSDEAIAELRRRLTGDQP